MCCFCFIQRWDQSNRGKRDYKQHTITPESPAAWCFKKRNIRCHADTVSFSAPRINIKASVGKSRSKWKASSAAAFPVLVLRFGLLFTATPTEKQKNDACPETNTTGRLQSNISSPSRHILLNGFSSKCHAGGIHFFIWSEESTNAKKLVAKGKTYVDRFHLLMFVILADIKAGQGRTTWRLSAHLFPWRAFITVTLCAGC